MDTIQTSSHPLIASLYTLLCVLAGIYASIINHVEIYIRLGAGAIAFVSGFFAIRYYWYATKKVKHEIKNFK